MPPRDATATRSKLLDAARDVIRAKGYTATTVDDICTSAGVTKGSFFHHFGSKEEMSIAAIEQFGVMSGEFFAQAPYSSLPDPLDRVLGYVDIRAAMLNGDIVEYSCLLGTSVQEVYATHPEIRAACEQGMTEHIDVLVEHIAAAKAKYVPDAEWTPESVGYYIQAVLQGSFIYAKVKQGPQVARDNLAHLRRYLDMLFKPTGSTPSKEQAP